MDLDRLQGTWRAVRIEKGGTPVAADVAGTVRYIFDRERVTLMEGDVRAGAGVIRLHPAADPESFDFRATEGPLAGATARGIYRVEAGALMMCLGDERPSRFTGATEAVLVGLTRIP
jgi:uncharacterized protein (TIGR03067 family)